MGGRARADADIGPWLGLAWLVVALLVLAVAVRLARGTCPWWLPLTAALVSQTLIVSAWQDAMAGTVVNLLLNLFNLGVDNKGSVTISTGSPSGSYISSGSSYLSNLQYPISNNVFASSPQSRHQAVQRYNSSSGASSNENKLWVTPGGAVITWSGGVIAPAPRQKR